MRFKRPIALGDEIKVKVEAVAKNEDKHRITFDCECVNQNGEVVIKGTAEVIAPTEKVKRPRVVLPEVYMYDKGAQFKKLIDMTKDFEPIRTAVVHPTDRSSILGLIDAAQANLIIPVLVGPVGKIREVSEKEGLDISKYELVSTEQSQESVEKAVSLAHACEVEALMNGSLHTDELMNEVVEKDNGLRTGRLISHVFMMYVPTYPRPLFITDAAINIQPDLNEKRDIVQNAIDLVHVLGIVNPKVAILSAMETVSPKIKSSIEAAALCQMGNRGQITGGIIDGPLAFDNAVSEIAAKMKDLVSTVAGKADILVVPDLEAGNMLVKQLEYLADAQSASIVLGAKVPIALISRADYTMSRMASCALAMLLVHHKKKIK
jgi:phosphate acetyltransferase